MHYTANTRLILALLTFLGVWTRWEEEEEEASILQHEETPLQASSSYHQVPVKIINIFHINVIT